MPQYHHNILCVTHTELTDGIMSKVNYDNLVRRGKIRVIRRGCYGTPALIHFDSMAQEIKTAVLEKYGNPRDTLKYKAFTDHVVVDFKAHTYFSTYKLADGRYLPTDVQEKYCNTAKVLNAMLYVLNDRSGLVKTLGNGKKHVWPNLATVVTELAKELGHDLPENPRRLKQRLEDYRKGGYETLVSGKYLNNNRSKVKDIQQEALLRQLFRKHNNLDDVQIQSLYNIVATNCNWSKISSQTVCNYREKWDLVTESMRRGVNNFDNTKAMHIKRKAPVLPLIYWTADGWDAELLYQRTVTGDKGYSKTTYYNRLVMVVVLDPCTKYPVGYAIGHEENAMLIREAFRNAINHTKELFGQRHKVLQLQTDNFSKKQLLPFYEAISAKYYTPARVKNAKSKVIEPYFKYINKTYCQLLPNWAGFGITAKKDNQPNDEYLNKIRHSFPDEAGCTKQLETIIAAERQKKYEQYRAAYTELPEEDKHFMNDLEYFGYLCETKDRTNRLSASGMVITMNNIEREYDCFDPDFRRYPYTDWTIKYDPSNMEQVMAISEDGSHKFLLQEKYIQPMALYDRKEEDTLKLQEVRNYNKSLKESIVEGMTEDIKHVDELLRRPELEGTLTKLILCDSNGQHKTNKSAARLNGQKQLQKQVAKEQKQLEKDWKQMQDEYLDNKIDISKYND